MQTLTPVLDAIAEERDYCDTKEFAKVFIAAEQSARKNASEKGQCFGVRPVKVGNKLLWPIAQMKARLQGHAK